MKIFLLGLLLLVGCVGQQCDTVPQKITVYTPDGKQVYRHVVNYHVNDRSTFLEDPETHKEMGWSKGTTIQFENDPCE